MNFKQVYVWNEKSCFVFTIYDNKSKLVILLTFVPYNLPNVFSGCISHPLNQDLRSKRLL